MQPDKWYNHEQRGCAGLSEMFDYDDPSEQPNSKTTKMMREVCQACPVREECLKDALHYSDEFTFRAGMTPAERKRLMIVLGIPSWDEKQKAIRPLQRVVTHGFGKSAWFYGCKCPKCQLASDRDLAMRRARDGRRVRDRRKVKD